MYFVEFIQFVIIIYIIYKKHNNHSQSYLGLMKRNTDFYIIVSSKMRVIHIVNQGFKFRFETDNGLWPD